MRGLRCPGRLRRLRQDAARHHDGDGAAQLPQLFVYGGAMLPGRWSGRDVTVLTAYEGVGSVLTGTMHEAELRDLERACAPTLGSCPGQFTANTMAMVSEALGLALPGSAMLPAVYSERLALARRAGRRVTEILRDGGPLPRDLVTRKSLENAAPPWRPRAAQPMPACIWPAIARAGLLHPRRWPKSSLARR